MDGDESKSYMRQLGALAAVPTSRNKEVATLACEVWKLNETDKTRPTVQVGVADGVTDATTIKTVLPCCSECAQPQADRSHPKRCVNNSMVLRIRSDPVSGCLILKTHQISRSQ